MKCLWHFVTAALLLGACGGSGEGFGVELNLAFDSSVNDARLAEVKSLAFKASGDETYSYDLPLGRAAMRHERTIYEPSPNTEHVAITVTAQDVNGAPIAVGATSTLTLEPGVTLDTSLTLSAVGALDGGTDDSGAGGPSLCPTFTGIACQGFESPIASPWMQYTSGNGTLTEVTSNAYRGTHAGLSFTPAVAGSMGAASQLVVDDLPSTGTVHMRGFFFAATAPPFGSVPLLSVQTPTGTFKSHSLLLNTDGTITTNDSVIGNGGLATVPFPLGEWVCVELAVTYATSGQLRVSLNGADQPTLALTGNTTGFTTSEFASGIFISTTMSVPSYQLLLDEIAIDTSPIGCAR